VPPEARFWCDAKTRVETGLPFKVILKTVEKQGADLLVMNVHGKRGLDRSLLDSAAERVVRAASCPGPYDPAQSSDATETATSQEGCMKLRPLESSFHIGPISLDSILFPTLS
jgi:hypothetical protein